MKLDYYFITHTYFDEISEFQIDSEKKKDFWINKIFKWGCEVCVVWNNRF